MISVFFFFKQKTAYEMRISDWSSDVCSSDLKVAGSRRERILILCKTYPSPSGKHSDTSCVAGMTEEGSLIRLFPVPFRAIRDEQKFKKWHWISAQIYKAKEDRRPDSHKKYSSEEHKSALQSQMRKS